MHREILQKLHIDGLRHETSGLCEKTNSIYIVFYLLYTTMSKWSECAHASGVWRVCARALAHAAFNTGRRRQRLTEGVSEAWCWRAVIVTTTNHILLWCCMNGLGICMRRSDWLTPPLALEKLKSFQLLPRAAPVKQRDGPTIQFANAWRHSIQSQREALTPTPCVNGALVCASAGKRQKWSLVRICHSLPERMHTRHIRVRTQITWTWLCTRGKKRYKYCSFSHTKPLVSCLRPSMCSYDGELFNLYFSVHVLFPSYRDSDLYLPLYDWQTRTVWPKNIKIGSTEEKKTPTSWMPLG